MASVSGGEQGGELVGVAMSGNRWHQHDVLFLAGQRVERNDDRPLFSCPRFAIGPHVQQPVERAGGHVQQPRCGVRVAQERREVQRTGCGAQVQALTLWCLIGGQGGQNRVAITVGIVGAFEYEHNRGVAG